MLHLKLSNVLQDCPENKIINYESFVFNGGECHIKIKHKISSTYVHPNLCLTIQDQSINSVLIEATILSSNDIMKVLLATDALRRMGAQKVSLCIPYIPYARQDRVMVEGEPFLNIEAVKKTIEEIDKIYPNTHHYISTIGIKGSDFSWIKDNITLQISLHSLDEKNRDWLIPYKNKMTLKELGQIRTDSNLKTTINMTLVENNDFDINKLKDMFNKDHFFVKLSPINQNCVSEENELGSGIVESVNLSCLEQ